MNKTRKGNLKRDIPGRTRIGKARSFMLAGI
jgi:hypothetical protein